MAWDKMNIKNRVGRPNVDSDLKHKTVLISLPTDLKDKLDKIEKKSKFIQHILRQHFNSDKENRSDFKFSNLTSDSFQKDNIQIRVSLPDIKKKTLT